MKKILTLLILTFLLSGCGLFNVSSFTLPDDTDFIALVQELDTPKKICQYMLDNFEYEAHCFITLTPYQLYLNKKGDCNDMTYFAQFVANFHGYETYSIRIFYPDSFFKHVIAIYKETQYSFSDNQYYFPAKYNTFLEIIEYDCILRNKVWSKYIVRDYDMNMIEQKINP